MLFRSVGPNGAGKTTLINTLAGILRANAGRLVFEGRDITQLAPHRFCEAGIAVVPEGRRLFTGMSVLENLELGSYLPAAKAQRAESLAAVLALFPDLKAKLQAHAGDLSGGQQQMVAIARALMARPKVLLLDEPSMGLSPIMVDKIFEVVNDIHRQGTTILLVEQNASRALQIASRGYVMDSGEVTMTGEAAQLLADPKVRAAYLGE